MCDLSLLQSPKARGVGTKQGSLRGGGVCGLQSKVLSLPSTPPGGCHNLPTSARTKYPPKLLRRQEKVNRTSKWVQKCSLVRNKAASSHLSSLGTWTALLTCCSSPPTPNEEQPKKMPLFGPHLFVRMARWGPCIFPCLSPARKWTQISTDN